MRNMFSNFKFTTLRPRTKSLSNPAQVDTTDSVSNKPKKSKTPLGSPVTKRDKKRNSELESCPSITSSRSEAMGLLTDYIPLEDRVYNADSLKRLNDIRCELSLDGIDCETTLDAENSIASYTSEGISTKVTVISVERIDGSLGITLRGGCVPEHPHLSRPLTVTQVRANGASYRTGLIRVGDRILSVDNHPLTDTTLPEAQRLLQYSTSYTTSLTVEYDVSVLEAVRFASGPLLVEIEPRGESNEELGLVLHGGVGGGGSVLIERVIAASTADRCGAVSAGDELLAVDDVPVYHFDSLGEIDRQLRCATKLQIVPQQAALRRRYLRHMSPHRYGNNWATGSAFSTLNSQRSGSSSRARRNAAYSNRANRQSAAKYLDPDSSGVSQCNFTQNLGVCHPETLTISLTSERGKGYGLTVTVSNTCYDDNRPSDIIISRIASDSPAALCGSLQVGDRVLAVNRQANLTLQEIEAIIEMGEGTGDSSMLVQVEFDVGDTVVPSTGIFTVRLPKRREGLGITITTDSDNNNTTSPFLITDIRRGSVAHRTGCLHAGDHLLAVDGRPLDRLTVDGVLRLLQHQSGSANGEESCSGVVALRVEKTETERANLRLDRVVYSVELQRGSRSDSLGITIAGGEVEGDAVIISRLTQGGIAEQTGALHANDTILAINGESLERRTLPEAVRLLQAAGDRVHLKIARAIRPTDNTLHENVRCDFSSPGLNSIDSAVHSWNSTFENHDKADGVDVTVDVCESVVSEGPSYDDQEECVYSSEQVELAPGQLRHYSDNWEESNPPSLEYEAGLLHCDSVASSCPSPLPLPHYIFAHDSWMAAAAGDASGELCEAGEHAQTQTQTQPPLRLRVALYKDSVYDDYGFSVSDGLYARGVFVNRIRQGGPADLARLLRPFDRIVQVNDTNTADFDCCLTVPLIASAGDRIELLVERPQEQHYYSEKDAHNLSKQTFSSSQSTITKTL